MSERRKKIGDNEVKRGRSYQRDFDSGGRQLPPPPLGAQMPPPPAAVFSSTSFPRHLWAQRIPRGRRRQWQFDR
eukprot:2224736-Pyramimonas_sp.AAC.1